MYSHYNHPPSENFASEPLVAGSPKNRDDRPPRLVYYWVMRKFSDTLVLVVSSFTGVLLFVKGSAALFILTLMLQYVAFISYATRIRGTTLKASPYIFNFGYGAVLAAYLLSCYLFKKMVF